jgi:hypothetical protein
VAVGAALPRRCPEAVGSTGKFQGVRRGVLVLWLRYRAVSWCSFGDNCISDAGADAIAVALVHVPQLQKLQYVAWQRWSM